MPQKKTKPSVAAGATAGCVIPEEIMLSIFSRLPVKSILRCKSVCKPWLHLLSTPVFLKLHHAQFSSDPDNELVIIQSRSKRHGRAISILEINSDERKPTNLDYPHPETYLMDIVGCCNGLICLGRPSLGLKNIVLWNPATMLFKFISLPENVDFTNPKKVSLGFGYDSEGDDFKVVVMFRSGEDVERIMVEVYSVNSDSWITVDPGFHFDEYQAESLFFGNGNPYWLVTFRNPNLSGKNCLIGDAILWFDVRKMDFMAAPLVTSNFDYWEMEGWLVKWKGSLAAFVRNFNEEMDVLSIDIWVFDDEEQNWRKDHTFGPMEVSESGISMRSENGKLFCYKSGKICVYNPVNGWIKFYDFDTRVDSFDTYDFPYTESLICIKGMRPAEIDMRKKKMIRGNSKRHVRL